MAVQFKSIPEITAGFKEIIIGFHDTGRVFCKKCLSLKFHRFGPGKYTGHVWSVKSILVKINNK